LTIAAAYLAAEGQETPLAEELARAGIAIDAWHGRLALTAAPPIASAWALDTWLDPRVHEIASIRAAADALRAGQRNWSSYPVTHHRRMALITKSLPPVSARPLVFPQPAPAAPLGAWTLLAPEKMLASATKTSPFVNGECRFEEDHIGPPSRAYLKLLEALTRLGTWPQPGETCLDLGAAPGGWSWVLAELGAEVTAVDKAPLDPRLAGRVRSLAQSAFALAPEKVDWLLSDVIAYPDRMLGLVRRWIEADAAGQIICTLKFQGPTDHDTTDKFAAIPGARLMHLFHNRHELTFLWSRP